MSDRRFLRLSATVAAALVLAPLSVQGAAADAVSQTRSVSGFDRIRVQGVFTTEVTAGDRRTRVVLTGDPENLSRVTTEVRDGTLVVGMRSGATQFNSLPKLAIAVPKLRAFANDGAGSATLSGLGGGDIEISNSGAASIVASGRAAREEISLDGTGKIDATGVDARDVTVDNNGLGSVHVRASASLSMNVNGVGEIRYTGNPAQVQSHINGIGRIGRL